MTSRRMRTKPSRQSDIRMRSLVGSAGVTRAQRKIHYFQLVNAMDRCVSFILIVSNTGSKRNYRKRRWSQRMVRSPP